MWMPSVSLVSRIITRAFYGGLFLLVFGVSDTYAQALKLELVSPGTAINVGDTFQVKVLIDTAGQQTINADALIEFESAKVTVDSAETANFYSYFSDAPLSGNSDQYLVSSWEESVAHAKSSSTFTPMATLSLTARTTGATTMKFVCTPGSEADSNINRSSDSQDILTNCAGLQTLSLTVGGSGSGGNPTPTTGAGVPSPTGTNTATVTVTPVPTVIATATPIPQPTAVPATATPRPSVSTLPRSGAVQATMAVVGTGIALTVLGVWFML